MNHKLAVVPIALIFVCGLFMPFTCVDAADTSDWGTPVAVDRPDRGSSTDPVIVVDREGNAMAIWGQYDGVSTVNVVANRYAVGVGWSGQQAIETTSLALMEQVSAGVDSNGNVTAAWWFDNGGSYLVYANRYVPGTGWGAMVLLQPDMSYSCTRPSVAVAGDDTVFVVWVETDPYMITNVSSCRYVPGIGWESPKLIEESNIGSPNYPQVAADDSGNAAATWRIWNSTRYDVWGNYYTAGVGWGLAQQLEYETVYHASDARVAMDGGGNATVVWNQAASPYTNLYANRYEVGSGWGPPTLIEAEDLGNAFYPDVWADGNGNAIAVWTQNDGVANSIMSNTYTPTAGWGEAKVIEDGDGGRGTRG